MPRKAECQQVAGFGLCRNGGIADHVPIYDDAEGVGKIRGGGGHQNENDQRRLHQVLDRERRQDREEGEIECRREGKQARPGVNEIDAGMSPERVVGRQQQIESDDRAQAYTANLGPGNPRDFQAAHLQRRAPCMHGAA